MAAEFSTADAYGSGAIRALPPFSPSPPPRGSPGRAGVPPASREPKPELAGETPALPGTGPSLRRSKRKFVRENLSPPGRREGGRSNNSSASYESGFHLAAGR